MQTYQKLINPKFPKKRYISVEPDDAVDLSNNWLNENNITDMKVDLENIRDISNYYVCLYKNTKEPNLFNGGGAYLIVRKSDGLCAMLEHIQDWLNFKDSDFSDAVEIAFSDYPIEKK